MRLSHYIDNKIYRDTTELIFFHGTTKDQMDSFINLGIKIVQLGDKKKDFGQGFYLTTQYWQSKIFAEKLAVASGEEPLIIACVIPLGALRSLKEKSLIIDDFNKEWLNFIIRGRFHRDTDPLQNDFHWIYGRCGDGITWRIEKEYKQGFDQKLLLDHIKPNEHNPYYEFDQLWLGTYEAISLIQSVEFLNTKGVGNYDIPLYK